MKYQKEFKTIILFKNILVIKLFNLILFNIYLKLKKLVKDLNKNLDKIGLDL
jgi:hypothetical protein